MVPYLIRRGVRTIDALIITHPDLDHFGGAAAIIRTLSVQSAYDPGVPVGKALYDSLLLTAQRRRTLWQRVRTGTRIDIDGVQLDFLHPDTVLLDASESANDYSAVFQLHFGPFSSLFLGDVSTEVEAALLHRYGDRLDVDMIKVGHHGSRTSTSAELLRQASPAVAMISVGRRNFYRHPSPQVIERLEAAGVTTFRTDQQGSVLLQVATDGQVTVRVAQ